MHRYNVMSGDENLAAATAETMIQIVTGATRKAKIVGFTLSFPSVTSTDAPAKVEFLLQTTAGTASAATPVALDQSDPAAIFTAQKTVTAEPTASTVIRTFKVTPVGGTIVMDMEAMGQDITMAVSTRVGMRVTSPAAQTAVVAEVQVQE